MQKMHIKKGTTRRICVEFQRWTDSALRRKETNRELHAGGTDHHNCGVPGRGEGNDGERGGELCVV